MRRSSKVSVRRVVSLVAAAALVVWLEAGTPGSARAASDASARALGDVGNTVYLPNVTKKLGGDDGWQTPFIVQNVGGTATTVTAEFYDFATGALARTRTVSSLAPGTSFFHDPNSDSELAAGGQYSVVIRSSVSPVVAIVNEHQNVRTESRQEALSYRGISDGSTAIYAPYFANQVDGWLTTLILQNLGIRATTARLVFRTVDGSRAYGIVRTVQPGRAAVVDPRFETILERGLLYAVTITATEPLGAVINAHNDAPTMPRPQGFSYNASVANDLPTNFLPYIAKNVDARSTELFIQNVSTKAETPQVLLCPLHDPTCSGGRNASAPRQLEPGGVWQLSMNASPDVPDGEYSVYSFSDDGEANYVAMVAATYGPYSAMGYSAPGRSTRWYLPNVTRTLGGPSGWTTPIVIQSNAVAVTSARLSWYRFSDGALVHRHVVTGLQGATAVRVDPRQITALSDDTQYAVVVESPTFGVSVIVTELNLRGGDAAMAYEAATPPRGYSSGVTGCTPTSAPAGSTFHCMFYGLPAGASPVTFTRSHPTAGTTTGSGSPIASDGSTTADYSLTTPGEWTVSASAGGGTATARFTVLPASFTVTATQTRNGYVSARTLPGIACAMYALQPDSNVAPFFFRRNVLTAFADALGDVSFSYPPFSTPVGSWSNVVRCTSGSETIVVTPPFTVP